MRVRMKVEGGDKLARKLQVLEETVAREHMRESILAGAEIVRAEAARLAPVRTGTLANDLQKEVVKQTKTRVEVKVGPGKKGWYGRLVEEGHAIVVNGQKVGDVPPKPFLRPAFDAKLEEAEQAAVDELRRRLGL